MMSLVLKLIHIMKNKQIPWLCLTLVVGLWEDAAPLVWANNHPSSASSSR